MEVSDHWTDGKHPKGVSAQVSPNGQHRLSYRAAHAARRSPWMNERAQLWSSSWTSGTACSSARRPPAGISEQVDLVADLMRVGRPRKVYVTDDA